MEVVGALAGVTQLAAYAYSTCRVLLRLIRQVEEGNTALPDSYNNSLFLLLGVLQRLKKRSESALESNESLALVVLDIARLANDITARLKQPNSFIGRVFQKFFQWPVVSETFEALFAKTDVLVLFLAEDSHHILVEIRKDLPTSTTAMSETRDETATSMDGCFSQPEDSQDAGQKSKTPRRLQKQPGSTSAPAQQPDGQDNGDRAGEDRSAEQPRDEIIFKDNDVLYYSTFGADFAPRVTGAHIIQKIESQNVRVIHGSHVRLGNHDKAGFEKTSAASMAPPAHASRWQPEAAMGSSSVLYAQSAVWLPGTPVIPGQGRGGVATASPALSSSITSGQGVSSPPWTLDGGSPREDAPVPTDAVITEDDRGFIMVEKQ